MSFRETLDDLQLDIKGEVDGLSRIAKAENVIQNLEYGTDDWQSFHAAIANIYVNLPGKTQADYVEKAIEHYLQVLKFRKKEKDPYEWARTQVNLGTAWRKRQLGNISQNLENAIACYKNAMTVYTLKNDRSEWGSMQLSFSNAYDNRHVGDPLENTETAIVHQRLALRAFTKEYQPLFHARAKGNLGILYFNRLAGVRSDNLERAIVLWKEALKVLEAFPPNHDWANIHANLSAGYRNRRKGWKEKNFLKSIEHNQRSFEVWTIEEFASDWARAHYNLAVAYQLTEFGDKQESYRKANQSLEKSLLVFTPSQSPQIWLKIMKAQCNLLARQKNWGTLLSTANHVLENVDKTLVLLTDVYERRRLLDNISTIQNLKVLALTNQKKLIEAFTALKSHKAKLLKFAMATQSDVKDFEPQDRTDTAQIYFCVQPLQNEPTLVFIRWNDEGKRRLRVLRLPRLTHAHLDWWIRQNTKDPEQSWLGGYASFEESRNPSVFMNTMDIVCEAISERLEPLNALLRTLPDDIKHLVVSPSGALSVIPFSILFLDQGKTLRMIDRFSIQYSTGIKPWANVHQTGNPDAEALIISDPRYNLKSAGKEANAVSKCFAQSETLHGENAIKAAVIERLKNLRPNSYVHLICHGRYSWRYPEKSHLELAGEDQLDLESVFEDIKLPLGTVVTMSACETGLNEFQTLPEESYGLPVAFLTAGADQVISALWPVSDYVTTILMEQFYKNLQTGNSIAEAMRAAQQKIRKQGPRINQALESSEFEIRWGHHKQDADKIDIGESNELHPYFWGAFAIIL